MTEGDRTVDDVIALREALLQQQATVERQYRLVEGDGYKVMVPCD